MSTYVKKSDPKQIANLLEKTKDGKAIYVYQHHGTWDKHTQAQETPMLYFLTLTEFYQRFSPIG